MRQFVRATVALCQPAYYDRGRLFQYIAPYLSGGGNAAFFAVLSPDALKAGNAKLHAIHTKEFSTMYTLFINGVPAVKLRDISEIPSRQWKESWLVVDAEGRMIDFYFPA